MVSKEAMPLRKAVPVTSTTILTSAFIRSPNPVLQLEDGENFHPSMDISFGNGCGSKEQETTSQFLTLQRLEEPQRLAKFSKPSTSLTDILVWWDFETCPLHSALSSSDSEVVEPNSLLGELQSHQNCDQSRVAISVYGNGGPDSKSGLGSLIAGGVTLLHRILPSELPGSETAALQTMMVDIPLWAVSNPATSNIFLMSTARDSIFSDLITRLFTRDYNIHSATKFFWITMDNTSSELNGFNLIPCHWRASREHLFVVQSAPSGPEPADPISSEPILPNKLRNLHVS